MEAGLGASFDLDKHRILIRIDAQYPHPLSVSLLQDQPVLVPELLLSSLLMAR